MTTIESYLVRRQLANAWQRLASLLFLAALLGASVYLFSYEPDGSNIYPTCPFHLLTGLHCPGCGSLRACHQVLHGDMAAAFGLNPLTVLSVPLMAWFAISQLSVVVRGRALSGPTIPASWIWALFTVIMLFWILRNVPVAPLTALAP